MDFSKRCSKDLVRTSCCGPKKGCLVAVMCEIRSSMYDTIRHVKNIASGIPIGM